MTDEARERRRAERREYYAAYKRAGVCVKCRRETAAIGFTMCPACIERENERIRQYRAQGGGATLRENQKRHYEKAKREGLCVRCGKPARAGRARCKECALKDARAERARRAARRAQEPPKPPGACSWCDAPALPGKKLCQKHYDAAMIGLAKAHEARAEAKRNGRVHPWEKDDRAAFRGRKAGNGGNARCGETERCTRRD